LHKAQTVLSPTVSEHTGVVAKFISYAHKIFLIVRPIGIDTKYNNRLEVDYESCRLLVRPFQIEDIIIACSQWEKDIKTSFAMLETKLPPTILIVNAI
jgi:hypothetical protein